MQIGSIYIQYVTNDNTETEAHMKNIETLKKNEIVTLNRDCSPMSGDVFKAGDKFKFLGWYCGSLVRLSRVGDCAKLTVLPVDIGYAEAPTPELTAEEKEQGRIARAEDDARRAADYAATQVPHSDESGDSRWIQTHSVLAGKNSGTYGMHLTPKEEREYNDGMAKMAEWSGN